MPRDHLGPHAGVHCGWQLRMRDPITMAANTIHHPTEFDGHVKQPLYLG
ncbi:hypothetical protein [Mycobacterium botniense]|nr:hypothetical protein [Mycobacterium botniense]